MKTKREGLATKEHFLSRREFILAEGPLMLKRMPSVASNFKNAFLSSMGQDPKLIIS